MLERRKWLGLASMLLLVAAFITSAVLGLRKDAPIPAVTKQRERDLPTVFSGPHVEVFNATRRAGLARDASLILRDAGFDVVKFGTTSSSTAPSEVIDRIGKRGLAEAVARTLGITRITTAIDSTRLVEVSVILGPDWSAPAGSPRR